MIERKDNMTDNLFLNMMGMFLDSNNYEERLVKNDKIGDYTIDTCYTSDYGYETAIKKFDRDWIVVERYANKEKSKEGHERWCKWCSDNPDAKSVYSVQFDDFEDF